MFPITGMALGTVLSIVLVEGAFKVMDVKEKHENNRVAGRISRVSRIPNVRYEMVPNITTVTPGQKIPVRINNLGFRGEDVSNNKPADTYRIAVLGDSISFGRNLERENIFPVILEESMNSSGKYDHRVEVVNASLSGRDTWEELAILEHLVLPLNPDLVVLEICLNDHIHFPPPDKNVKVGMYGDLAWWQYSSLLSFLDKRVKGFREYHLKVVKKLGLYHPTGNDFMRHFYINPRNMLKIDSHWREWSKALMAVRDLSRSNGAEVMFLLFPLRYEIKRGFEETSHQIVEFTDASGIPLLDMIGFFEEVGPSIYDDSIHPNAWGHHVVARELERFISARFLTPSSPEISRVVN
jgi:lysophospholipase L1-like esterase